MARKLNINNMPVFNVAFLNPKTRAKSGGTGISILTDQLNILEQELGKDGYMSQGDWEILIQKAREIQTTPGLSASQISDYDVKISKYEKNKELAVIDRAEDLEKMNATIKSESAEDVMMVGNNPAEFLRGRIASYESKINDLQEIIQRREISGQDSTEYQNEYLATINEYQEKMTALASMEGFNGTDPLLGYVAYVKTNSNGEIIDVDYARHGSKQGYTETNGMIDGFQIYGMTNFKREGKNFFILGDNIFQAPDMLMPDPSNPGSFKPNKLVADVTQKGPITVGESGYMNIPGNSVKIQSYLPYDSWAKGVNGTVYKRRNDGGYTKYLNVDYTLPDMPDPENMITLPSSFEKSIMRNADETIDASMSIAPREGLNNAVFDQNPLTSSPLGVESPYPSGSIPQPSQPTQQPAQPTSSRASTKISRTPQQPVQKASEGVGATIQRTVKSGVDYLRNIFA